MPRRLLFAFVLALVGLATVNAEAAAPPTEGRAKSKQADSAELPPRPKKVRPLNRRRSPAERAKVVARARCPRLPRLPGDRATRDRACRSA